jgi:hypothetical protein
MDCKTFATILFRVLGLAYLVYAVFYAPYLLFTASYSGTFIISALGILTYIAAGILLILLSKPLAALAVMGLSGNNSPPPPPPDLR